MALTLLQKNKSKKGKKKKNKNYENTQEANIEDTVQGLQIDNECVNFDLETAWQKYWDSYGEYLVWEGWVNKYPEQIDYDMYNAIPCVAEEEVSTDEHAKIIESYDNHDVVSGTTRLNNCPTSESDTVNTGQILNEESTDTCTAKDSSFVSKNVGSMSPQQFTTYQTSYNNAIQTTMRDRFENQDHTDVCDVSVAGSNQAKEAIENMNNHESEVVHMMHTYASIGNSKGDNSNNPTDEGEINCGMVENEAEDDNGDYDIAWQELWNEHYTESYWYYYSEFRKSFNQLKSSSDSTDIQNDNPSSVQSMNQDGDTDFNDQNKMESHTNIDVHDTKKNCSCEMQQSNEQTDSKSDVKTSLPGEGMLDSDCSHSGQKVNVNDELSKKCDDVTVDKQDYIKCQSNDDKVICQCQSGDGDKICQCTSSSTDDKLCHCPYSSDDEGMDGGGEGKRKRSKAKSSNNSGYSQGSQGM